MDDEIVIKVKGVYKDFILPHQRVGSVKNIFTSLFRKVTSQKEHQHALRDISFEIQKGEFFGIVGRNGSGKSTLLKILAGIYQPTKGIVQTSGRLVPFIELGVGFNPELTGRDNVYLNGAMLGFSRTEVEAMYHDIVEFAELENFMDQKLKNYSSGMQVRLAFSMATRSRADILLVDEVLAVGDADFQRKCFDYFKKLKKIGTTVIFVTHDMGAVREYCDRALLIENSKIINIGATNVIAEQYLQLFTETNDQEAKSQEGTGSRWGDGAATIQNVLVNISQNNIIIQTIIIGSERLNKGVIGVRLRDSTGREVTGTNTKFEEMPPVQLPKTKATNIKWTMNNILTDGQYIIDVAVQHEDANTVADWWDEAASFRIKKKKHLPYPFDPGFNIEVG